MVERSPFLKAFSHLIMVLGVIIVGFPLVLIGSWYSVRRHESKQGTDATVGSGAGLGTDAGISAPGEGGKPPIMAAGAGHRPASEVQTE